MHLNWCYIIWPGTFMNQEVSFDKSYLVAFARFTIIACGWYLHPIQTYATPLLFFHMIVLKTTQKAQQKRRKRSEVHELCKQNTLSRFITRNLRENVDQTWRLVYLKGPDYLQVECSKNLICIHQSAVECLQDLLQNGLILSYLPECYGQNIFGVIHCFGSGSFIKTSKKWWRQYMGTMVSKLQCR